MNLLARLSLALKVARGTRDPTDPRLAALIRTVADHNAPIWPNTADAINQADEYTRSAWVYVAVTRIAEAASLVPFGVYRLDGEKQIALNNHPLEQLLRAPNPTMSQFELLESTFGYLELTGNAYWYLAAEADTGSPAELWVLRPDRVRVVPDRARYVGGYIYSLDGIDIPLLPDSVIHFKRWHPRDDLYGLSALSAATLASSTDRAMAQWNNNLFGKEKGVPAGIVSIKNMVPDSEFERIKREWLESYGGTQRKTAFIRGSGEIGYSNLGLSQQESDFIEARRLNRDEIFGIFGIPLGLYAQNATQANATVARSTFLADTIYPKLVRFAQKLTQQLAPFYGDNLIVLPEDVRGNSADLAEVNAARDFLTINEIRAQYFQMDSVAWGDVAANQPALIHAQSALTPNPSPGGEGSQKPQL